MASVGKGGFSAFLPLTAREQVKSSARCPGLFSLPSFFEHLHAETPKSQREDGGRARNTLLFSLFMCACVCVEPSGAKIIKINIYESSRYFFFLPKLVHCKVIKP